MMRLAFVLSAALMLACPARPQSAPDSFPAAMQALTREIVRHPQPDVKMRRMLALVVASAKRVDEIAAAEAQAGFRAALVKQVRRATAVLSLLGSDSLGEVRAELAGDLQRSFGGVYLEGTVSHFMGAVANREARAGVETEIGQTVQAVVHALRENGGPQRNAALAVLLVEAAAVIDYFGPDSHALAAIREELARL